jgi:electron transfer flavoprotein beta subunit
MNIIVFVKRVPDTREADVQISKDGKSIETKGLVFDINDWDKYAVEEAVRLKEKLGGSVTAITLGPAEADDALRRCFATGVDNSIRLTDPSFDRSDPITLARILVNSIKSIPFDLLLFGAQAGDDGCAEVGPAVAEILGLPHASLVMKIDVQGSSIRAQRELESGLSETLELPLPAVVSVQSGINEPRYVSIMGIRKASSKEIKTPKLEELGLKPGDVGEAASRTMIEKLFIPPVTKQTELLSGSIDEMAVKLTQLLRDKGGIA